MTPLLIHLLTFIATTIPWECEAAGWAVYMGVSPTTVIAVFNSETADLCRPVGSMCDKRINSISHGNYGISQLNCPTWKGVLTDDCKDFLDMHDNLAWGVNVLARFQHRYKPRRGDGCRVHNRAHHWTCHWNGGGVCDENNVAFGARVLKKIRRMERRRR